MEENRINRRYRPRPYDLRRKVLLKNFLREQMTYIPETRVELLSQHFNNTDESSVSVKEDDFPELNDVDNNEVSSSSEDESADTLDTQIANNINNIDIDSVFIDSKKDVADAVDNTVDDSSPKTTRESSLFKFTSLVKIKKEPKTSFKSITKAKEVCKNIKSPMKTRSFKSGVERIFYGRKKNTEESSSQKHSKSPRSLFSLFKHRKGQRNNSKDASKLKRSACVDLKNTSDASNFNTTNQSVQTEDSWVRRELIKVQQSNERLKEENRLLSESLSYFMSNSSTDTPVKNCGSPLQSSNHVNNSVYPDYYVPAPNSSSANWHHRPRVSRSKSVQECDDRRSMLRNNYRTRSMNYHNYRSNSISSNNKPHMNLDNAPFQGGHIPRMRRKNSMNLPINNSVRNIQRRSSMPERILSENNRTMVCRRSESVRNTRNRQPFHSLPSDAFY